jgi:hypothetical protein
MASTQEKCDWLKEHLVYEYDMLRYSYAMGERLPQGPDWNAYYECFAVHARLLSKFLASDSGSTNFDADDFVEGYAVKPDDRLGRRMNSMNEQVFHSGKQRKEASKKINGGDLAQMHGWLCHAVEVFASKLPPPCRECWTPATITSTVPTPAQQNYTSSIGFSTGILLRAIKEPESG